MKRHLTATAVVVALMAAAAGTAVGLRWIQRAAVVDQQTQKNDAQTPPAPVKARPSIAVMGFRSLSNRSGAAWLSSALSEMFTTELAAGGQLRVVPAETVSRFRLESALKDEGALPKDLLSRIRNNLGADFIVGGSYLIQDQNGLGQLRLDLRVQNTQQDAVVALSETGFESDLFTVVAKAGSRLRERLGLDETGAAEVKSARAAFPVNPEAGRLYTAGLEKMRLFDAIAARSLFEQAAALDSRHALTHSALSAAWSSLGYDGKAEESAKKAYELSENLTREQRLVIEGRYRESQRDWSKAIETYRTLWGFFSDDVEYGLRLAAAQVAAGQAKEALATVQAMRQLPAPSSDDPRIDIAEGDALGSLSDFKRQQQTYAQAVQKGRALGAQLLVARARLFEGRAFFQLGQPEDAIHAFQEAQPLFINAGDRAGVASVLSNLATVYGDRSDIPRTIQMLKESLAISREIGDKRQMATALNNLAIDFKDQGRFADARQTHEEALALRREIGDRLGAATSLNNIGVVFFEQDEFAEAAKRYQESLQICREIGNQRGIVRALHNLSIVKRELGDLAEARTGYEESLAIRKEIGDKRGGAIGRIELGAVLLEQGQLSASKRTIEEALSIAREVKLRPGEAQAFYFLGEIALAEGDLATARKHHEAAQAIRKENREERTLVESRLALANVSLEDGRAIEAEADLRDLRDHLGKDKTRPTEAMIELLIARALLAQNKTGEAGQALTRAQTLSAGTQRNYVRAMITITGARLAASQKQSNVALQNLNPLLAALNRSGAGALQFEARLAQCEAELQSSQASVAKGCFAALQKDATARGFRLVARRANRLGS
jgi:tetratricopeptide (TPR) repeat protein